MHNVTGLLLFCVTMHRRWLPEGLQSLAGGWPSDSAGRSHPGWPVLGSHLVGRQTGWMLGLVLMAPRKDSGLNNSTLLLNPQACAGDTPVRSQSLGITLAIPQHAYMGMPQHLRA